MIDNGTNIFLVVLSVLFFPLGIILYFAMKRNDPIAAKIYLKTALIAMVLWFIGRLIILGLISSM